MHELDDIFKRNVLELGILSAVSNTTELEVLADISSSPPPEKDGDSLAEERVDGHDDDELDENVDELNELGDEGEEPPRKGTMR